MDLIGQAEDLLNRVKSYRAATLPQTKTSPANATATTKSSAITIANDASPLLSTRDPWKLPVHRETVVMGAPTKSMPMGIYGSSGDPFTECLDVELQDGEEEDDIAMDDVYIERLLAEGGPAPSQICYPGLYSQFNEIAARLRSVRFLCVEVQHINILNASFGIRKAFFQLQLQPPVGCSAGASGADHSRTIDVSSILERRLARQQQNGNGAAGGLETSGTAQDYLVGPLALSGPGNEAYAASSTVLWDVDLSNDTVFAWMGGTTITDGGQSCNRTAAAVASNGAYAEVLANSGKVLRVQFKSCAAVPGSYSSKLQESVEKNVKQRKASFQANKNNSTNSPGTMKAKSPHSALHRSDSMLSFGSVSVPLHGLLCTPELDAYTTVEVTRNPDYKLPSSPLSLVAAKFASGPGGKIRRGRSIPSMCASTAVGSDHEILATMRLRISLLNKYPVEKLQRRQISVAENKASTCKREKAVGNSSDKKPGSLLEIKENNSQEHGFCLPESTSPTVLPEDCRNSDTLNRIIDDAANFVPSEASGNRRRSGNSAVTREIHDANINLGSNDRTLSEMLETRKPALKKLVLPSSAADIKPPCDVERKSIIHKVSSGQQRIVPLVSGALHRHDGVSPETPALELSTGRKTHTPNQGLLRIARSIDVAASAADALPSSSLPQPGEAVVRDVADRNPTPTAESLDELTSFNDCSILSTNSRDSNEEAAGVLIASQGSGLERDSTAGIMSDEAFGILSAYRTTLSGRTKMQKVKCSKKIEFNEVLSSSLSSGIVGATKPDEAIEDFAVPSSSNISELIEEEMGENEMVVTGKAELCEPLAALDDEGNEEVEAQYNLEESNVEDEDNLSVDTEDESKEEMIVPTSGNTHDSYVGFDSSVLSAVANNESEKELDCVAPISGLAGEEFNSSASNSAEDSESSVAGALLICERKESTPASEGFDSAPKSEALSSTYEPSIAQGDSLSCPGTDLSVSFTREEESFSGRRVMVEENCDESQCEIDEDSEQKNEESWGGDANHENVDLSFGGRDVEEDEISAGSEREESSADEDESVLSTEDTRAIRSPLGFSVNTSIHIAATNECQEAPSEVDCFNTNHASVEAEVTRSESSPLECDGGSLASVESIGDSEAFCNLTRDETATPLIIQPVPASDNENLQTPTPESCSSVDSGHRNTLDVPSSDNISASMPDLLLPSPNGTDGLPGGEYIAEVSVGLEVAGGAAPDFTETQQNSAAAPFEESLGAHCANEEQGLCSRPLEEHIDSVATISTSPMKKSPVSSMVTASAAAAHKSESAISGVGGMESAPEVDLELQTKETTDIPHDAPQITCSNFSSPPPQPDDMVSVSRASATVSNGKPATLARNSVNIHVSLEEVDKELERTFAIIEAQRSRRKNKGLGVALKEGGTTQSNTANSVVRWKEKHGRQFIELEANRVRALLSGAT